MFIFSTAELLVSGNVGKGSNFQKPPTPQGVICCCGKIITPFSRPSSVAGIQTPWKAKCPIFKAIIAGFRGKVAFKKIGRSRPYVCQEQNSKNIKASLLPSDPLTLVVTQTVSPKNAMAFDMFKSTSEFNPTLFSGNWKDAKGKKEWDNPYTRENKSIMSPKKIPFQKESSLPTIIFQGTCLFFPGSKLSNIETKRKIRDTTNFDSTSAPQCIPSVVYLFFIKASQFLQILHSFRFKPIYFSA